MPRSNTALEALIQELDEVRTLAGNDDDPALSQASLAVARVLSTLKRVGRRRYDLRPEPEGAADAVIDEARRALSRAREALAHSASERRKLNTESPGAPGEAQPGAVSASCCGCGRRFVVHYVAAEADLVAFPLACPWEECDAVTEVAYPEDATSIEVVPAVR